MKTIRLNKLFNDELCVGSDRGEKVWNIIYKYIKEKKYIVVSFKGINVITIDFLQNAIGRLYGVFDESRIKEFLHLKDFNKEVDIIKRVIDNAKIYFKCKKEEIK